MKVYVNVDSFTYRGKNIPRGEAVDLSDDLAKANLELGTVTKELEKEPVKEMAKEPEKKAVKEVEKKKPKAKPKAKKAK